MDHNESKSLIRVPDSVEEFKPLKRDDLNTEATLFLRSSHWEDVKDFYKAIAGEIGSIKGSPTLDEAACIFKVQEIAQSNGFALIGTVSAEQARKAFRVAYKRNTGIAVRLLEQQNKQLRLESREALREREAEQREAIAAARAERMERREREKAERPEREAREAQERAERMMQRAREARERAEQMTLPGTIRVRG